MWYTFELFDKEEKPTKSGVINKNEKIPYTEEDAFFTIRAGMYPYQVIKEGILNKSIREKKSDELGVVYSSEIGNIIELYLKDHTEAITHTVNGTTKEYKGRSRLQIPRVTGKHTLKSKSKKSNVQFQCVADTMQEHIRRSTQTRDQQLIAQEVIRVNEGNKKSAHEAILNFMRSATDDDMSYNAYLMLKQHEAIVNSRNRINTKTYWSINNLINCEVEPSSEIDYVDVYEIIDDQKNLLTSFFTAKKTVIYGDPYTSLLVEGYKDGDFVSSRIASVLPDSVKNIAWKMNTVIQDAYLSMVEKGKLASVGQVDESIDEVVRIQNSFDNYRAFIDRPKIIEKTTTQIEVEVPEWNLLQQFDRFFYIVFAKISEIKTFSRTSKIILTDFTTTVDLFENGIDEKEDLLFWIEDENGVAVSDLSAYFVNDVDEERQLMLDTYDESRIESMFMQVSKEVDSIGYQEFIRIAVNDILTSETATVRRTTERLIEDCFKKGVWVSAWSLLKAFLLLRQKEKNEAVQFFNTPLLYHIDKQIIAVSDSKRSYVAIVESFDEGTHKKTTQYYTNESTFSIKGNYNIIRFIDPSDYSMSGFAAIGKERAIYGTDKINVKVVHD